MAWTYTGDPSSSPRDEVRFKLGDTDTNHQLVQDEEIDFCLTETGGSVSATVYKLAVALRNKFAAYVDEKVDEVQKKYSDLYKHFSDVVNQIEKDSIFTADVYAGGISKSDKKGNLQNTDNVRPKFDKNLDEHMGGRPDTSNILLDT